MIVLKFPQKNLFRNISVISVAFIFFLQGCGGSSSVTSTPAVPIERTFLLSSVLVNDCGIEAPFTDIELLHQDSNWRTIAVHKSDENGVITFNTFEESINYTLVAKNQEGNGVEGLNIESYNQAKTTTVSRYVARHDQNKDQLSCQCLIQDVELSHKPLTSRETVTSSLVFERFEVLASNKTLYKNVEVCRELNGNWPLSSFVVIGEDFIEEGVGVSTFNDNFDANTELVWQLSAFDDAKQVTLNSSHQAFNSTQLIQGLSHFPLIVNKNQPSLLLFNSHIYNSESLYHSTANLVLAEKSSFFGSVVIESSHSKVSSVASESFAVKASTVIPDIDDVNFSEIKADGRYDYSSVKGYPMAVISFELITFHPTTNLLMPTKWTNYGPEKGVLAISLPLTGYTDIVTIDTKKTAIDTVLLKSNTGRGYQDYIQHYQSKLTDDFANDLKQYHIRITQ
mgnify:CR=1 FL=1|jgi:hypothetical protein